MPGVYLYYNVACVLLMEDSNIVTMLYTEGSNIVTCTAYRRQQCCYMCYLQKIAMLLHVLSTKDSNVVTCTVYKR